MNPISVFVSSEFVCLERLTGKPFTRSNLIRVSDTALKEMNSLLFEKFAENIYD